MDAKTLNLFASDPTAFRAHLVIASARGPRMFGSIMAPFQRRDFAAIDKAFLSLAAGQKPAIGRIWLERTKGASKDTDLAAALLWLLAFSPRPLVCQVGAADADQADEIRKAAKGFLRANPQLAGIVEAQAGRIVNPKTGSECTIIAADVAGSHGARPDLLILNELSHVGKREFAENLLDNASKVPHGCVVICTNAGFTPSWQWDWRENARTSKRWYWSSFAEPAPWLDPEEIAEARRRNSPLRFSRLWQGQWVRGAGDALTGDDIEAAVTLDGPLTGAEELTFYGGLDLGVSRDHSALAVVGLTRDLRLKLAYIRGWAPPLGGLFGRKIDLGKVEAEVWAVHKKFRLSRLFYDPHQAELMAQNLMKAAFQLPEHDGPIHACPFTPSTLTAMASALLERFHSHTLDLFPDKQLLADLHGLQLIDKGLSYRLDSARTSAGHGDRAVALCLAVLAAERHPMPPDGAWDPTPMVPGNRSMFAGAPPGVWASDNSDDSRHEQFGAGQWEFTRPWSGQERNPFGSGGW